MPALDGVRGLAVLAVLAYHLDLGWAGGGFLGVEIFFALSGFLITQLVADELIHRGSVDAWAFLKARVRRLVPALLACVVGTTALFGWLMPDAVPTMRTDAFAALLYVQNWHLVVVGVPYAEAFDTPSPFLHLWSLSVEGQLYLLWPLLLVGVLAVRGRLISAGTALLLAGASAVLMAIGYDPDGGSLAYYATDARASGFLVGAALALVWLPGSWSRPLRWWIRCTIEASGVAALAALVYALVTVSEFDTSLYREGGLIGVGLLTAVVIVAATRSGLIAALLARAPLVALGRRSYGLYLYHWPLIVLVRELPTPHWLTDALACLATAMVAELSYRWLETPIRRGAIGAAIRMLRLPRPAVIVLSGCLAASVISTLTLLTTPGPTPTDDLATAVSAGDTVAPTTAALTSEPPKPSAPATDSPGPATTPPALVVGDSIALGSADALRAALGTATEVDAKVGRQFSAAPDIVRYWAAINEGPIVIDLGANGTISDDDVNAVVDAAGDRRLVLVGVSVPRRWQSGNNAILRATAASHPATVAFVDWADIVADNTAVLGPDHVHPNARGRTLLANAIQRAVTGR